MGTGTIGAPHWTVETERKIECLLMSGVADASLDALVVPEKGHGCLSGAIRDKVMKVLTAGP